MRIKVIYSRWLAYELRKRGFKILRTGINERYPQYDTYFFEDSRELEEAITDLTK